MNNHATITSVSVCIKIKRIICYELWVNYQFDFLVIKGYLNYKYLWCLLYNKVAFSGLGAHIYTILTRGDHFRFGLVFIKKITKSNFFFKNRNRTETGSNRPVSVRFFRTKTGSNWFGSVFLVWLDFGRFDLVFFGLGLVRFFWF